MRIKNRQIAGFIEYIIIVLSIILSATMWVQPEIHYFDASFGRVYLTFFIILWNVFCHNRINKSQIKALAFICLCIILCLIFHISYSKTIILTLLPILFLCYFGIMCDLSGRTEIICSKFVNIICVIALVSLVFYSMAFLLNLIVPTSYYRIEWSWINSVPSYYGVFYNPMPNGLTLGSLDLPRNCGVYPEAPMFMYPLVLALLINKLVLNNKTKKNILLVVTIVSTFSITGYIVVVLLYTFEYLFYKSVKKHILLKLLFPFVMIFGTIVVYYLFLRKIDTGSGNVRTDHVIASFKAFANTNGLGCGIGNESYVRSIMKYKQGISVGLPYLFATGGVFWGAIYTVPLIKSIVISLKKKNYEYILFAILFTLLLFMTACHSYLITWIVFGTTVFASAESKSERVKKKEAISIELNNSQVIT